MFIKDNIIYLDNEIGIQFDNFIFRIITTKLFDELGINDCQYSKSMFYVTLMSLNNKYVIVVNIFDNNIAQYITDRYIIELPNNTKDFLLFIKKLLDAMYNNLLILRKNNVITNITQMIAYNPEHTNNNLLYIKNGNNVYFSINGNYNNTIIININNEPNYDLVKGNIYFFEIKDNKLIFGEVKDTEHIKYNTIYYFNDFEYQTKKIIDCLKTKYLIKFVTNHKNYITKTFNQYISISYLTPQSLLLKFIENIEFFISENIYEFTINNEYDLFKYI